MTNELSEIQKQALRGELTLEQFNEIGMGLFQMGICTLDPLDDHKPFRLTEKGVKIARHLQGERDD